MTIEELSDEKNSENRLDVDSRQSYQSEEKEVEAKEILETPRMQVKLANERPRYD
jgi:hypothetical protein